MATDEERRWQEDEVEENQGLEKTALVSRSPGGGVKQVSRGMACSG